MNKQQEEVRVRIAKKALLQKILNMLVAFPMMRLHILVYTWVRSGAWKPKDFNKWLRVMRVIE